MYTRADGVAVVLALVAHATVALALVNAPEARRERPSPIEIEIVPHRPIEEGAARQPPPAAAPLPKATQSPVKIDKPKTVVSQPKIAPDTDEASEQIVEAPQLAAASKTSATTVADGGSAGGTADGVAGGIAGGVKGGSVDGRPGGDALVGPSYGADYLRNAPPHYPAIARRMNLEGTTTLRVVVSAEGRPTSVKVHISSGVDALDEAALDAVQHWSFVPAHQGNTPVAATVNVPVRFRLDAAPSE